MLELDPIATLPDPFVTAILSILSRIENDPGGVLKWSNDVLDGDPGIAHATFASGVAHLGLGQYGLGIQNIQRAISRDRRSARACHLDASRRIPSKWADRRSASS